MVKESINYGTGGRERDAVRVSWPKTDTNSYRLGYRGKVDLLCVKPAKGCKYYVDHLLPLFTTTLPKIRSIRLNSVRTQGSRDSPLATRTTFGQGDRVMLVMKEDELKRAQTGHGGWNLRMRDYIGKVGTVSKMAATGDCSVTFDDGKQWTFNPVALTKVNTGKLKVGDIVRVLSDEDRVVSLQQRQGWQPEMKAALGKAGKVVKIDSDGDVAVTFGSKSWVFNPLCLEPAAGAQPFIIEAGAGARMERTESASSTRSTGSSDSDDGTDTKIGLDDLLAHMILLGALGAQAQVNVAQRFIRAAANNDVSEVEAILKRNQQLVDEKFKNLTALIISSHEGHIGVVRVLLKAGADKDITDEKGNTALMAALMKNRESVALLLVEEGANIHLVNRNAQSALHFAASTSSNLTLRELLRRKADPTKQDVVGDTPLHDAIANKNHTAVDLLLEDPRTNQKLLNKKGFCALHMAAMKDDARSVRSLLAKTPGLLNAPKDDGFSAIHLAAFNNNCDVLRVLLELKADTERKNKNCATALHLACHKGYKQAVELLIKASANLNTVDEDGDTPLHNVVMGSRNVDMFAALMGLRITSKDEIQERIEIACMLIERGANTQSRNKRGKTAVECCSNDAMKQAIQRCISRRGGSDEVNRALGGVMANLLAALPLPCPACSERIADAVFQPCGHKVCCTRCAFRVRECPLCDMPILARTDLRGRRIVANDECRVQ